MMNPCSVCEDTNYNEVNGSYFCSVCGTKYEGEQVMEAEFVTNANFKFSKLKPVKKTLNYRAIDPKPSPLPKVEEPLEETYGNHYDIYQMIMMKIVDVLIEMGANEALKEIVLQLWMEYLSHNEKRLGKEKEPKTPKPEEKNAGEESKSPNKASKMDRSNKEDEPAAYDDSNGFDEDKKLSKKNNLRYRHILTFCYLGLIHTNPLTTVSDLLRWVYEYRLPFLNGEDHIPDCYKTRVLRQVGLSQVFRSSTIKHDMRKDVDFFMNKLKLTSFPKIPIDVLVKKYIILLNLPGDMQGLCTTFVNFEQVELCQREVQQKNYHLQPVECRALSYIIVVLELLFGLNDHTERELSTATRKLMKLTNHRKGLRKGRINSSSPTTVSSRQLYKHTGHKLFVYEDWLRLMKVRQVFTEVRSSNRAKSKDANCDEQGESTESVFGTLNTLSKLQDNRQTGNQPTGSGIYSEADSHNQSDIDKKGKYFESCSLKHITNPKSFMFMLDKGKGQSKVQGHTEGNMCSDTQFNSPFKKQKKENSRLETVDGLLDPGQRTEPRIDNKEQFDSVIRYIETLKEQLKCSYSPNRGSISFCFDDVVNCMSKFIQVPSSDLRTQVLETQNKIMGSQ